MPSFPVRSETLPDNVMEVVHAWCGADAVATPVRRQGGNSRVFHVVAPSGTGSIAPGQYALKLYLRDPGDGRDRIGAETAAIDFLRRHGLNCVPAPIKADPEAGALLLEWIEGSPVDRAIDADVDAALEFAARLYALGSADGAERLPPAAEATPSPADILDQIESRRVRLSEVGDNSLRRFLERDFVPVRAYSAAQARQTLSRVGLDFATVGPLQARTLSPSDFGFHNALRRPDGSLAFLDFEYFGWDDTVRLVADFLLHPGMTLSPTQRRRFAEGAVRMCADDTTFSIRLAALYPLIALRWCLIVLKPFLPGRTAEPTLYQAQLAKARRMLARAQKGLEADLDE